MHAAVVTTFDKPPAFSEFPTPTTQSPDELLIDVIASGLHPRVRSQADGSHYTSSGDLPLVPGIDGVGRTPEGDLYYFVLPDTTMGAMSAWRVTSSSTLSAPPAGPSTRLVVGSVGIPTWVIGTG